MLNLLKTKFVRFRKGISAYRVVNTFHLSYTRPVW